MSNPTTDEPTYYASAAFTGVGFSDPADDFADLDTDKITVLLPEQVEPGIREVGRGWLARKRAS